MGGDGGGGVHGVKKQCYYFLISNEFSDFLIILVP